ncbi:two-component system sensor histidine kinase NtrB [Methylobacillus flagellatus]|uniref:two-component system sensor histidine kinase NtrB n=1 Tax=Methylobacillus flagellatus TaxID=405 RepID=UPI0010F7D501|nr:ATP-binding protein [Methylobacillus flagellatus]
MTDNTAPTDFHFAPASTYWRSMVLFNLYRFVIAGIFILSYSRLESWWSNFNQPLAIQLAYAYLAVSIVAAVFTWLRKPQFNRQVTLQTLADICLIVALMYASGGLKSGLGLLLVITIAGASVMSQGRLALVYAAYAMVALMLEQSLQLLTWKQDHDIFSHIMLLGFSCFATAWLAHSFARRALQSEALASQRGLDLANLGQLNELITQEMQDGVVIVDQNFVVRHYNLPAQGLLGMDRHPWKDRSLNDCAPQIANLLRAWIYQPAETTPSSNLPGNTLKLNNSGRELQLRMLPIGPDRLHGAVIFLEDWSQMQTHAQQLKLAALGRLTASIAHEIRNPLSSISHANQLLQEDVQDSGNRRLLQIIADNVERMEQMVQDVLQLNRRDRTQRELIKLDEFLQEFHAQFCQVENIPTAQFKLQAAAEVILFDRGHLDQILWNLCRNGWRHANPDYPVLTLAAEVAATNDAIRIEVSDNGSGVQEEIRSHLFEPFFTTAASGTGLGLYITRELCEANDASIHYEPLSVGSRFVLLIKKGPA